LLLACQRHFRGATASALSDSWSGDRFIGKELSRLTLGVLGVGRLGKMVVQFGKAFCMRVLACEKRMIEIPGVTLVDFDTLLRESDAISIHIHLTPENHHLFDDNAFHRMKQGAVLINTSRGDIVDEAALLRALESGRLAAYGADVIHNEWQPQASSLIAYARTHENVVLTPHIGGKTLHGIGAAREFMARKLAHFLKTGEVLSFPLAR
jgi:D-3-phosphoglycerate dehydrogenase